ncbi:MAG: [protein-PII] uridylyltransferase [Actinomycetota bacterium]|nr:[protein-PII] uridylyltransferase [Actinomycetota bacterium]
MSDLPTVEASSLVAGRRVVLEDQTLSGVAFTMALSDATDAGLRRLFGDVCGDDVCGLALVAMGGYGRGELAPASDLDLLLLHDGHRRDVDELAAALWYPLWDGGVRLGHAVRTIEEQLRLAADDVESATASLTARHVAGSEDLTATLRRKALEAWRKRAGKGLEALARRDAERHDRAGEVAYLLEPDVKDGVGGLRDVQSLHWASAAGMALLPADAAAIELAAARLVRARVALHRVSGRYGDVLRLESQDAVAAGAGAADADELMADVAAAGRTVAWVYEQSWSGHRRAQVRRHPFERVAPGVELRDGSIELAGAADPGADPTLVFQLATAAARRQVPIGRATLVRLTAELPSFADRYPHGWPVGAVDELVGLLLEAHRAIPVLESLDQAGLLARILPEWDAVRSRPQRNAYHRFTVDRHLWEAAANAAELADSVSRPDLLLLVALFHDLGKGFEGDHTEVGVELIGAIGPRLGLVHADVELLAGLIRNHLLLADVALRRDLADPATTANVAAAVRTSTELELLHALTIADSKATGPTAWSEWKAGLIAELVERTRHVLGGGESVAAEWRLFPDAETLSAMASGTHQVRIDADSVTTVTLDRPGTFARVAGALSLHRLDVVSAEAHSEPAGSDGSPMAASRFRFLAAEARPLASFAEALGETIEQALAGELAIDARLAERARSASRRRRTQALAPDPPSVTFVDDASDDATVIEIRAPTVPGLLHRLAKALADVGLDIRHATVQTIGPEAVDTFYVVGRDGSPITDPFHLGEIRRAVLHAVAS